MVLNAPTHAAVERFLSELKADLLHQRLPLPSLPEVARKARQAVDNPDSSNVEISRLISTDAVLSSKLLQLANSAYFRGMVRTDTVHNAVMRLGRTCVRNLVVSLTMAAMFKPAKSQLIKPYLKKVWTQSTLIAATSQVLATKLTKLDPAQAMLGGLVHNIGALPILVRYTETPELLPDINMLDMVINQLAGMVGQHILRGWDFPPELVVIPQEHTNLQRDHDGPADFTDIVCVATLHSRLGTKTAQPTVDWSTVPALAKLELNAEKSIQIMKETKAEIGEVQRLIG